MAREVNCLLNCLKPIIKTVSMMSLLLTFTYFTNGSGVSVVDFEQINAG